MLARSRAPCLPCAETSRILEELQRSRINAIPQPRRRRPIIKHVPQMRIAPAAGNLGTRYAKTAILARLNIFHGDRLKKLGQPVPELNFAAELNNAVPQHTQRNKPFSSKSQYSPLNANSVSPFRAIS